jgi:glutamate-1-semialdehyde 2,1-aminomutase
VKPGSGVATLGLSGSPGVPEAAARDTLTCPYNNLAAIEECFHDNGPELAAVILEPIVGNAGFIRPVPGFLERLRELCDQYGTVLIFDEVMTGFRVAWGGYQNTSKIRPDMTVLGKVIGGGLPVGAYGGKREIMSMVAPSGPVYQAGTLSGNPVAMASGIKTLEILSRKVTIGSGLEDAYARLGALSQRLMTGMKQAASAAGISLQVDHEGGMFGFFFSASPVLNFADAQKSDTDSFRMFFNAMLDAGFYFAPSAFEAGFLSLAHTDSDIDDTVAAFTGFCASLRRGV